MAQDASLWVRQALVTAMKEDADILAQVVSRVYGPAPPAQPVWPFIRYGLPSTTPFLASCLDGSRIAVTVHVFAKGADETAVSTLAYDVAKCLSGEVFDLPSPFPAKAHVQYQQTQYLRDTDEATGWHGVVTFVAEVVS